MAHHETDIGDKIAAIEERYLDGEFSETVLRTSLYCLKLRGEELEAATREIMGKAYDIRSMENGLGLRRVR